MLDQDDLDPSTGLPLTVRSVFFIGTDKHAYLEKAVAIGGDESLRARAYEGLKVTEIPEADRAELLPTHVTENEELAPLMAIR